jgi:hypothetical protein
MHNRNHEPREVSMKLGNPGGDAGGVKPFGEPVKDNSQTENPQSGGDVGGIKPGGDVVVDNTEPHTFG